mmetsp:Transcript_19377/g.29726  ORF Transcript_19377/g.29726 Transcript_19377/m.29726 type:complete len:129 (-) Transcript_19377:837-1223(-)|eukprot:CAMPEP_0170503578 /NCGR_PEP_ID=MMETSP0208-20121228/45229_1 /TAXON_ID=197538 /ORGANISM="Strombidium inclinatum, Strain S3" /LENGTH=128 /DNA_ID=CAMNT_0010783305 /DNA_START=158 /DNA_END=544 /DNA_ORIENTATION=-
MIPRIMRSDYTLKKAYREVALLRQLSALGGDQHVSKLLDIVYSPKYAELDECQEIFIIMEFSDANMKTTLRQHQGRSFEESGAIKLLYRLLCSMKFIHEAGVMHRDIKPANILVDEHSVKLCDFGLSR